MGTVGPVPFGPVVLLGAFATMRLGFGALSRRLALALVLTHVRLSCCHGMRQHLVAVQVPDREVVDADEASIRPAVHRTQRLTGCGFPGTSGLSGARFALDAAATSASIAVPPAFKVLRAASLANGLAVTTTD